MYMVTRRYQQKRAGSVQQRLFLARDQGQIYGGCLFFILPIKAVFICGGEQTAHTNFQFNEVQLHSLLCEFSVLSAPAWRCRGASAATTTHSTAAANGWG